MRIYLGSRQVCMPQYLLDRIKVRPPVQHMCGKSMAEYVGTPVLHGSYEPEVRVDHLVYKFWIQGLPLIGQK